MSFSKLSESDLWGQQAAYFREQGLQAWNGQVPFHITSNAAIADAYSHLLFRLIAQTRAQRGGEPLHVIELGTGSGRFSFLLLRRLDRLVDEFGEPGDDFVYVMSDFAEANVKFWEGHEGLRPFARKGRLDFAVWDAQEEEAVFLRLAGRNLGARPVSGPLAVIANYALDAMKHDVFVREERRSCEVLVRKQVSIPKELPTESLFTLAQLSPELERRDIDPRACYDDPALNAALESCLDGGGTVLFPSGGLRAFERLRRLAPELFVLVADKGDAKPGRSHKAGEVTFGLHGGCFSCSLNFAAIEQYALHLGGSFACRVTEGLVYAVFTTGFTQERFKELALDVKRHLGAISPGIVFEIKDYFVSTKPQARLETLLSLLELSCWDPDAFDYFHDVLCASLPYASTYAVQSIVDKTPEIAAQIYRQPGSKDTVFGIGVFLQKAKRYEEALHYYGLSLTHSGSSDHLYYNTGLCHYWLRRPGEAKSCFEQALALNPRHVKARGWIAQIECDREEAREPALSTARP